MKKWLLAFVCLALLGATNAYAAAVPFNVNFGTFTGTTPNPLNWGPLSILYSTSGILVNGDGYLALYTDIDGGGFLTLSFSRPTWGVVVNFSQTTYNGDPLVTDALALCNGSGPTCPAGPTPVNSSYTFTGSSSDTISDLSLDFLDANPLVSGTTYAFLVDSVTFTSDVPEPGTILLLGAGLAALAGRRVWRRRSAV